MKKLALLLFLFITQIATTQVLDPSFDGDGLINNPISNSSTYEKLYASVKQSDGKIIYAGKIQSTPYHFEYSLYVDISNFEKGGFVYRNNSDGTRDNSFNSKLYDGIGAIQDICLQSDGKILLVGLNKIYRLNSDGTYDISFNNSGIKTFSVDSEVINLKCISVQSDSKIVVSGYKFNGSLYVNNGTQILNYDFLIARFNNDGTLDQSFGNGGFITYDSNFVDYATCHKIQPDGKILIVGDSGDISSSKNFLILRINTNGDLDFTFGNNGVVNIDFNSSSDYARDVEFLNDNKILILGSSAGKVALAKLDSNGFLDLTFNSTGKKVFTTNINPDITSNTLLGSNFKFHSLPRIKLLDDGNLLISCTSNSDYSLLKINNSGDLITTFANNGIFSNNINYDTATVVELKNNGNILLGGFTSTSSSSNDAKSKEIELNNNGVFINYINKSVIENIDGFNSKKVLINGDFFVLSSNKILSKYSANGNLITSFGNFGRLNLQNSYNYLDVTSNGKIVLANSSVLVLNPDGTNDLNFNFGNPLNLNNLTNGKIQYTDALKVTSDDKILISSDYYLSTTPNYNTVFGLLKLNLDGTLDQSFGVNGIFNHKIHPISNEYAFDFGKKIHLQSDGKYLIQGLSLPTNQEYTSDLFTINSFVIRLNTNGTIDSNYASNGIAYFLYDNNRLNDSSILINDKLLLSYRYNNYSKSIKLNANGILDSTFGNNGISLDYLGEINIVINSYLDGKYLKGGQKNEHIVISRYNEDGSLDSTFGLNGEIILIQGNYSSVQDIYIQADGKIVVSGYLNTELTQNVILARFTNENLGNLNFEDNNNNLIVYPNPIVTSTTFEFELFNQENLTLEMYDITGKIVKTFFNNKSFSQGKNSIELEFESTIPTGNYILKLSSSIGSQSIQIIKK